LADQKVDIGGCVTMLADVERGLAVAETDRAHIIELSAARPSARNYNGINALRSESLLKPYRLMAVRVGAELDPIRRLGWCGRAR
jgi:hypothetical protein